MQPQQRWWKEAGTNTPMIHVTGIFGRHAIYLFDAEGVKQVLLAKANGASPRFLKGLGLDFGRKIIGDGLVTINGDEWHRHRKIMQPLFDNQVLKEALYFCIPDLMDRFVGAWKVNDGREIDIASHFAALTLDIIGKVAFSQEFQAVKSVEQWSRGAIRQVGLNNPIIQSLYSSVKRPSISRLLLSSLNLGFLERFLAPDAYNTQVTLDQAFADVVDRSYYRSMHRDTGTTEPMSLLDHLVDAQTASRAGAMRPSLTHKELQGEMKTLIFAGTTMSDIHMLS